MSLELCKSILSRSSYFADLSTKNPSKEKAFWATACQYAQRAHQMFLEEVKNNNPAYKRENFNVYEQRMLETGVPVIIQVSFFDDVDTKKTPSSLPLPPSAWDEVSKLQSRIKELEDQAKSLVDTTTVNKLQSELETMQQHHEQYVERSQKQQTQLSTDLKRMSKLMEHKENELEEMADLRQCLEGLKKKFDDYKSKNYQEIQRLYSELESKAFELETERSKTSDLHLEVQECQRALELCKRLAIEASQTYRKELEEMWTKVEVLQADKDSLQQQNDLLKATWMKMAPSLSDEQQKLLMEAIHNDHSVS